MRAKAPATIASQRLRVRALFVVAVAAFESLIGWPRRESEARSRTRSRPQGCLRRRRSCRWPPSTRRLRPPPAAAAILAVEHEQKRARGERQPLDASSDPPLAYGATGIEGIGGLG